MAIHCRIRPLHQRTSVMKFSFPMFWLVQSIIFGCIIPIHRITICLHGPFPSPPVSIYIKFNKPINLSISKKDKKKDLCVRTEYDDLCVKVLFISPWKYTSKMKTTNIKKNSLNIYRI